MNKEQLREIISDKMKLIRVEYGYTQNLMAEVLGLSKKTLVQIEKERTLAGWTTVVAVCALFQESEVLKSVLGDSPVEIVETIAHQQVERPGKKTLGGKVWWQTIAGGENFTLQQNLISQHYRIIDRNNHRRFSTIDRMEAENRFEAMAKKEL
ncbi:helix-turn-helix transcriptional regulator [Halobacillus litoralis]|uniref:Transcriptional regulator n=1 Tax=Halobacillus litoralis TaxID=45668 RepID=A0A410M7B9_9BACI|nr:helix-turn-helix domain-containing protein [Halobacillus litoralis]QAS50742.1 transcriptional regulator [Halobacillus litoralis]